MSLPAWRSRKQVSIQEYIIVVHE
jgi:hypothetical protein